MQKSLNCNGLAIASRGCTHRPCLLRDVVDAGSPLDLVDDMEREPRQLREAPRQGGLAAAGIAEHRHPFHAARDPRLSVLSYVIGGRSLYHARSLASPGVDEGGARPPTSGWPWLG